MSVYRYQEHCRYGYLKKIQAECSSSDSPIHKTKRMSKQNYNNPHDGNQFNPGNPPFPYDNYHHQWPSVHPHLLPHPIQNGISQLIDRPSYGIDMNDIGNSINLNINQNLAPINENNRVPTNIRGIRIIPPATIVRPYSKLVDKPEEPSKNDSFGYFLGAYVKMEKNDNNKSCKPDVSRMNRSLLQDEYANLSTEELDQKVKHWKDEFKKLSAEFIDENVKAIADRHCLRTSKGTQINTGKEAVDVIYRCKCNSIDDCRALLDHLPFAWIRNPP